MDGAVWVVVCGGFALLAYALAVGVPNAIRAERAFRGACEARGGVTIRGVVTLHRPGGLYCFAPHAVIEIPG